MCIICVSRAGTHQPNEAQLRAMFQANPHGAGYMTARQGRVEISKGFMTWHEFIRAVRYERFSPSDAVIYHFRISTQAGISREMTHPFPLTKSIADCKMLDVSCPIGVAHNGVIRLTSDSRDTEYSDTAHFIAEFLAYLVRNPDDLKSAAILDAIARLAPGSRFAFLDSSSHVATVGDWITDHGLLFSNGSYRTPCALGYYTTLGDFDLP